MSRSLLPSPAYILALSFFGVFGFRRMSVRTVVSTYASLIFHRLEVFDQFPNIRWFDFQTLPLKLLNPLHSLFQRHGRAIPQLSKYAPHGIELIRRQGSST